MAGQTLKPPFAYYGGKTTLAPKIAALLPEHDHYVEPFAGSLAVLLAKDTSKAETVNDIDGDLMTFWRVLRDMPDELERACALTPHSRGEHALARDTSGVDDLERARRVFVQLTQDRTHSMKPSGWRFLRRVSPPDSMPKYRDGYCQRMAAVASRLSSVSLDSRDAMEVISAHGSEPSVCIYADPPYLGSTRASGYRMEMLGDDAHVRLANALNDCKASVVLSGCASPLYEELFDGWNRTDIEAPSNMVGKTGAVEVLWSNVPLGQQAAFDFGGITS